MLARIVLRPKFNGWIMGMGFASLNGRLAEVDVKVPVYVCQDCYNFEHSNNTTINSLLMHSTERTKVAINIC